MTCIWGKRLDKVSMPLFVAEFGTDVAIKLFFKNEYSEGTLQDYQKEIDIMKRLRHQNVLLFMGAAYSQERLAIVTEFLPRGSLFKTLHMNNRALDIRRRLRMALDVARRALRALKALVKVQALVRGHIKRKRTAEWLHRMQALMQAQARAIGGRSQVSEFHHSTSKCSNFHNPGPAILDKFEHSIRSKSRKHDQPSLLRKSSSRSNGRVISDHDKTDSGSPSESQLDERSGNLRSSSVRNTTTDDKKSDRILEINTGKPPHITPKRRNLFHSSDRVTASDHYSHSFTTSKDSTTHYTLPSRQPLTPLKLSNNDVEEGSFCTANNSRQLYSASSKGASLRRSPFTPSDYPNYMACTESSKAKVRSLSAPKQRPNYERSSSAKRYSINGVGESKQSGQRISALHVNFMICNL